MKSYNKMEDEIYIIYGLTTECENIVTNFHNYKLTNEEYKNLKIRQGFLFDGREALFMTDSVLKKYKEYIIIKRRIESINEILH